MPTAKQQAIEIVIHGLGGQGLVVAKDMLAQVFSEAGYEVQSFSQYGAERRGGKVESYLRISRERILVHSRVYEPDYLFISDPSLLHDTALISSVKERGTVLVNCTELPKQFEPKEQQMKVVPFDADGIAIKHDVRLPSGMPVINTTVVGAFAALFPEVHLDFVLRAISEKKIPAVEKSLSAASEAFLSLRQDLERRSVGSAGPSQRVLSVQQALPEIEDRLSPCEVHCLVGVPVRKMVRLIERNQMAEAWKEVIAENPFPGICGRVCYHPCESNCNRRRYDAEVAINALERSTFDYGGKSLSIPYTSESRGNAIAIVGAGPAGMSCAHFLRRMGYRPTVFEQSDVIGGIPRLAIPAYRLPRDVVQTEMQKLLDGGIEVKTGIHVDDEHLKEILETFDACFIATGAHRSVRLSIPGEDFGGVIYGLDFLRGIALGREVTVGRRVAVIGGGNTAIDAARSALRLGAKEVVLIYRRSREEMPAYAHEVEAAERETVNMIFMAMPTRIQGSHGRVSGVECLKTDFSGINAGGRKGVQPLPGTDFELGADTVIVSIGEAANLSFLPEGVKTVSSLVSVDALGGTSLKSLFAGGDVTSFERSVANAIASGKRAALGIHRFLEGGNEAAGDMERQRKTVSYEDLNVDFFTKSPSARVRDRIPALRVSDFEEVSQGLSEKSSAEEAGRCFQCGRCTTCGNCYIFCPEIAIIPDEAVSAFNIRSDVCKECGICVEVCPRGAIQWQKH